MSNRNRSTEGEVQCDHGRRRHQVDRPEIYTQNKKTIKRNRAENRGPANATTEWTGWETKETTGYQHMCKTKGPYHTLHLRFYNVVLCLVRGITKGKQQRKVSKHLGVAFRRPGNANQAQKGERRKVTVAPGRVAPLHSRNNRRKRTSYKEEWNG